MCDIDVRATTLDIQRQFTALQHSLDVNIAGMKSAVNVLSDKQNELHERLGLCAGSIHKTYNHTTFVYKLKR